MGSENAYRIPIGMTNDRNFRDLRTICKKIGLRMMYDFHETEINCEIHVVIVLYR